MMTQNADKKCEQIDMLCRDEMVPSNHLLRIIDKAIDWRFIYKLVENKYSQDTGRPSMNPVTLTLKEKENDDNNPPPSAGGTKEEKTIKCSTTDPESGWFRKGEHKHVFAYAVETVPMHRK